MLSHHFFDSCIASERLYFTLDWAPKKFEDSIPSTMSATCISTKQMPKVSSNARSQLCSPCIVSVNAASRRKISVDIFAILISLIA